MHLECSKLSENLTQVVFLSKENGFVVDYTMLPIDVTNTIESLIWMVQEDRRLLHGSNERPIPK